MAQNNTKWWPAYQKAEATGRVIVRRFSASGSLSVPGFSVTCSAGTAGPYTGTPTSTTYADQQRSGISPSGTNDQTVRITLPSGANLTLTGTYAGLLQTDANGNYLGSIFEFPYALASGGGLSISGWLPGPGIGLSFTNNLATGNFELRANSIFIGAYGGTGGPAFSPAPTTGGYTLNGPVLVTATVAFLAVVTCAEYFDYRRLTYFWWPTHETVSINGITLRDNSFSGTPDLVQAVNPVNFTLNINQAGGWSKTEGLYPTSGTSGHYTGTQSTSTGELTAAWSGDIELQFGGAAVGLIVEGVAPITWNLYSPSLALTASGKTLSATDTEYTGSVTNDPYGLSTNGLTLGTKVPANTLSSTAFFFDGSVYAFPRDLAPVSEYSAVLVSSEIYQLLPITYGSYILGPDSSGYGSVGGTIVALWTKDGAVHQPRTTRQLYGQQNVYPTAPYTASALVFTNPVALLDNQGEVLPDTHSALPHYHFGDVTLTRNLPALPAIDLTAPAPDRTLAVTAAYAGGNFAAARFVRVTCGSGESGALTLTQVNGTAGVYPFQADSTGSAMIDLTAPSPLLVPGSVPIALAPLTGVGLGLTAFTPTYTSGGTRPPGDVAAALAPFLIASVTLTASRATSPVHVTGLAFSDCGGADGVCEPAYSFTLPTGWAADSPNRYLPDGSLLLLADGKIILRYGLTGAAGGGNGIPVSVQEFLDDLPALGVGVSASATLTDPASPISVAGAAQPLSLSMVPLHYARSPDTGSLTPADWPAGTTIWPLRWAFPDVTYTPSSAPYTLPVRRIVGSILAGTVYRMSGAAGRSLVSAAHNPAYAAGFGGFPPPVFPAQPAFQTGTPSGIGNIRLSPFWYGETPKISAAGGMTATNGKDAFGRPIRSFSVATDRSYVPFAQVESGFSPATTGGAGGALNLVYEGAGGLAYFRTDRGVPFRGAAAGGFGSVGTLQWDAAAVPVTSIASDTEPCIAEDFRGRLFVLFSRKASYCATGNYSVYQVYSDDDGLSWSIPVMAFPGGKHPVIRTGNDGTLIRAAFIPNTDPATGGTISATFQAAGDAAPSPPVTLTDQTGATITTVDDTFSLTHAKDGASRWVLIATPFGATQPAEWWSADECQTFTSI